MRSEMANDVAAMTSEVALVEIGLPVTLGLAHPALPAVGQALRSVGFALACAGADAACGKPEAVPAALHAQVGQLRTLAAQVSALEGPGAGELDGKLRGIADVLHLLAGGDVHVPA